MEAAHTHEKRVAVHAYGLQAIRNAVDAGVDTVERGCYLDEAVARRKAEQGTSLVTTPGILKAILKRGNSYCRVFCSKTIHSCPRLIEMKVGIVGCGTIGSEIAAAISGNTIPGYSLAGLFDIDEKRVARLRARLPTTAVFIELGDLIEASDLIFEATHKSFMPVVVEKALSAGKIVVAMSVGGIADRPDLIQFAEKTRGQIYLPSGAICGIDGILAAREAGLSSVQITSTKHPKSFVGIPYLSRNNISIEALSSPKIIFEGTAAEAIEEFPANVNVSITLGLAGLGIRKTRVRIVADPTCEKTRHEIIAEGNFGRIRTVTEGVVAPNNPRTGYLAIVSAKATLRRIGSSVRVGT